MGLEFGLLEVELVRGRGRGTIIIVAKGLIRGWEEVEGM